MADEKGIIFGRGMPTVLEPFMGPIDEITESIRYRAQLVARDQKLGSGVSASAPLGFAVGLLFALLMVFLPVFFMT